MDDRRRKRDWFLVFCKDMCLEISVLRKGCACFEQNLPCTGLYLCEANIFVAIFKPVIRKKWKKVPKFFSQSKLFLKDQWICIIPFPKYTMYAINSPNTRFYNALHEYSMIYIPVEPFWSNSSTSGPL